jgi:hypothetical protein
MDTDHTTRHVPREPGPARRRRPGMSPVPPSARPDDPALPAEGDTPVTATIRQPATPGGTSIRAQRRRGHRAPKGAAVLDLIFKVRSPDQAGAWTATLRSDPAVVIVAGTGEALTTLSRDLALAILQGHGRETLTAMRQAGTALPEPGSAA